MFIVRSRLIALLLASLALAGATRTAEAADVQGSRDHPLVKRYEGSVILRYSSNAFDLYRLPVGPVEGKGAKARFPKGLPLQGRVTRITYLAPVGRSTLEVMKNYEQELSAGGFTSLFAGAHQSLGEGNDNAFTAAAYQGLILPSSGNNGVSLHLAVSRDDRFLAARRSQAGSDVHVAVYAVAAGGLAHYVYTDPVARKGFVSPGRVLVQVDVIEAKPLESRMVTVAANEMARSLTSSGSVALYGILFDSNSAEIKSESTPTLDEIAKLLKTQPALRLLVVGHTDNVGAFEFNVDLSQRRATSVVRALTSRYGIDAKRLTPVGVSFSSPVASNKTEEGRAKNRRVQLVENEPTSSSR